MIFACSGGEDNDASVSADFDPRNGKPCRNDSLERGGDVSLSECEGSTRHRGADLLPECTPPAKEI
jgi:hypothetical protein